MLVTVPFDVPFSVTLTPIKGSRVEASSTEPLMLREPWANAPELIRSSRQLIISDCPIPVDKFFNFIVF
jgi:hypothetical protein